MTRDKLLRFIRESKILLSHASPEQKIRIVKLLREGLLNIQINPSSKSIVKEGSSLDYLDEK